MKDLRQFFKKTEGRTLEAEIETPTFWMADKQPLQRVVSSYLDCPIRSLSQKSRGNAVRRIKKKFVNDLHDLL